MDVSVKSDTKANQPAAAAVASVQKMSCTILTSPSEEPSVAADAPDPSSSPSMHSYKQWKEYDIDVVPLREHNFDSNFVIVFKGDGTALYQPVSSRVVLSQGREKVAARQQGGGGAGSSQAQRGSSGARRRVQRRKMNKNEEREWNESRAEVDKDLEDLIFAEMGGHA